MPLLTQRSCCGAQPWGENECSHGEDVGLCCWGNEATGTKGKRKGMSYFPRCPSAETPELPKSDDEEAEEGEGATGVYVCV